MKHKKFGFTLIEVSLFLAITGMLFAGIAIGVTNSIWQQRFNDTTQNFAEFLRSIYSEVSNPQSIGSGRSEFAIYGKLVVFGETVGLDGQDLDLNEVQKVFVYDVIGSASGSGTGDAATMLGDLGVNVIKAVDWWDSAHSRIKTVDPAGIVESYSPRWASAVEKTGSNTVFTGSILVVRHPRSGTINTLVSDEVIEVNKIVREANHAFATPGGSYSYAGTLSSKLSTFTEKEIDFCVNPYGINETSSLRRNIRLVKNARNASGVEIIDLDGNENVCRDI